MVGRLVVVVVAVVEEKEGEEEGEQLCNTSRQQPVGSDFCKNIVRCRGQFRKPNYNITHLFCFLN